MGKIIINQRILIFKIIIWDSDIDLVSLKAIVIEVLAQPKPIKEGNRRLFNLPRPLLI